MAQFLRETSYREALASTLSECLRLGELVRSEVPESTTKQACLDTLTRLERLLFNELAANDTIASDDFGPGHIEAPGEEPIPEPEAILVGLQGQWAGCDEAFELDPRD